MVTFDLSIDRICIYSYIDSEKGRATYNICLQTHISLQAHIINICKIQNKMYLKCQRRYKIVSNCLCPHLTGGALLYCRAL